MLGEISQKREVMIVMFSQMYCDDAEDIFGQQLTVRELTRSLSSGTYPCAGYPLQFHLDRYSQHAVL